jgi:L-lactate dehydrogenase complex protein LldG
VAKVVEILKDAEVTDAVLAALPAELNQALARELEGAGIGSAGEPFPARDLPARIDRAQAGITGAAYAIAQSGTLVEVATDDAVRLVSSLPRLHIGIVRESDILPHFEDAAGRLRELFAANEAGCAVTFISGPSRTGDIELKLTLGVHGPETAHAIVIRD